ncbi:MAG: T9SS type A sorting domain-containing protein, partial [Bacteroidales bacterium]
VQIKWQVTSTNAATRIYLDDIAISGHPKYLNPGYYTGIEENNRGLSLFRVYPNPAGDFLNIQLPESTLKAQLVLINLQGQMVKRIQINENNSRISLSDLESGFYMLRLNAGDLSHTEKILVQ